MYNSKRPYPLGSSVAERLITGRQPLPDNEISNILDIGRPAILGHTHGVAGTIIGRRPPIIAPIIAPVFPKSPSDNGP